ncbi:unnamed protein product [Spirodela intermedia]|uniref:Uncharacterized protein n=2 Tax=Spirodela intermedia TaxID=51605 RepID=A0A7I8KBI9_SPIIN|nr:unnamed protein product [Spirodela intermedia]CAA6658873.1 unnamed protein product [Spirodela intermedia]CAA7395157.1 unnamed protein product [Spirodela intermedia]
MDPGISEEIKGIEGAATGSGEIVESMPMEWTDEKHNSYLNSIEASFVNQLYNHEFNSNHLLGWSSRTQKNPHLSGPHTGSCYSGQFKVLRGGCWSEVKFERSRILTAAKNETRVLSRNPWIQHFRSNSDNEAVDSCPHMEINCTSEQEIDIGGERQGEEDCGEAASSSQLPSCCTHVCHEDSLRSSTVGKIRILFFLKASGQNFVDDLEGDNRVSRLCKKRYRTTMFDANHHQAAQLGKLPTVPRNDENVPSDQGNDSDCTSPKAPKID